jgi:aldehyde:ferredoxin oxidoreductase
MKAHGYMGKILRVDLSSNIIKEESLDLEFAKLVIGGSGLGAGILFNEMAEAENPLSYDNPLIFATGPVTGTNSFNSDRFEVVGLSPLTGIYGESNAGGRWGGKFKKCGYDAMIITGKAEKPVYINIQDDKAEIKDAGFIWGKDTFISTEKLKEIEGEKSEAAVIGPAGENHVKMANIITDGRHGRCIGRCGFGAVMGTRNLKAVVVNGTKKVEIADPEALKKINKRLGPTMKENPTPMREAGTANGLDNCEFVGNFPVKNWSIGRWSEGAAKITGYTMTKERLINNYNCGHCAIGCGRIVESKEGPHKGRDVAGPEYETLALLGANCLIDDLDSIIMSNELCNQMGLDTISVGNVIGFAMEAAENDLIDKSIENGLTIRWSDTKVVHKLIDMIAHRRGIGEDLSEGVRAVAAKIGGIAEEFAVHVKGLEPAAHDPRAKFTVALGYATSNRGACHLQAFTHDFEEGGSIPDLGLPVLTDRFSTEGKAENVVVMQHLMSMFDSLSACKFGLFGGLTIEPLVEVINAVTGWDWTRKDFFEAGERIFNLKRLINNRLGVSRKDDTLPPRYLMQKKGGGTDKVPPLNVMLTEYYDIRGWDEFGIPKKEKLKALGLLKYAEGICRE